MDNMQVTYNIPIKLPKSSDFGGFPFCSGILYSLVWYGNAESGREKQSCLRINDAPIGAYLNDRSILWGINFILFKGYL